MQHETHQRDARGVSCENWAVAGILPADQTSILHWTCQTWKMHICSMIYAPPHHPQPPVTSNCLGYGITSRSQLKGVF